MRIIVIGAGEVGYHIAARLTHEAHEIVVIERNPEVVRRVEETLRVRVIEADGSSPRALEAAGVGIWDMDYTTGVLQWSATVEAHYGLLPDAFRGTFEAFIEGVHPEDRASLLEIYATAKKSGSYFTTEHRSLAPDGEVRWLTGAGAYCPWRIRRTGARHRYFAERNQTPGGRAVAPARRCHMGRCRPPGTAGRTICHQSDPARIFVYALSPSG